MFLPSTEDRQCMQEQIDIFTSDENIDQVECLFRTYSDDDAVRCPLRPVCTMIHSRNCKSTASMGTQIAPLQVLRSVSSETIIIVSRKSA